MLAHATGGQEQVATVKHQAWDPGWEYDNETVKVFDGNLTVSLGISEDCL